MNGSRKCGIYIQWNFIQSHKKYKILSFAGMDVTGEDHIKWCYPGAENQKLHIFLSYVEYRPNENTAILWKTGHAKGGQIGGRV
jgi:hypothetical protein